MVFNWHGVGSQLLNTLRESTQGVTVTYEQDGTTINNLIVSVARTEDNAAFWADGTIRSDSRHYIIEKAKLIAGGITDHPHRGTTITEADGSIQTPVPDGLGQLWDWKDSTKTAYVVRCQTVEE